jgi:hypothetical protein
MRAPTLTASLVATIAMSAAAAAQTAGASAPAGAGPVTGWSATAGREAFEFRDISRNMNPPDASPVKWRGQGPVLTVQYERARPRSSHMADLKFADFGHFEYVSPTGTIAGAAGDAGSHVEVRYEYRRFFWRDLGIQGFHLGGGIQGIGARLFLDRHISSSIQTSTAIAGGGVAGVVTAQFDRWHRFGMQCAWANGGIVSNRHTEHSADSQATVSTSGGNWLTDLTLAADYRITATLRVTAAWRANSAGYASSHLSFAGRRQSITAGLLYGR